MKRTISIKLLTTPEDEAKLSSLRDLFNSVCNQIVPFAVESRCWNRVALHHLSYYKIKETCDLGSQMICNAIHKVCSSYKVLGIKKTESVPTIQFRRTSSVHFDKRTYSIKGDAISLYTLAGRIKIPMQISQFHQGYLAFGEPKEAELICKKSKWYFNLVLDIPDQQPLSGNNILGCDVGENTIAALSNGKIFDGGQLRHERDQYLNRRRKLQSNGSKSAKKVLKRISGKEQRHVKDINHQISKAVIKQAVENGFDAIAMEDLTHIRKRIKAGRRIKARLHRWSWRQLQSFIEYKAEAAGLKVIYINPAWTSKTCSCCEQIGVRNKHRFTCSSCGIQRHSDVNAASNIRRIASSAELAMAVVNQPMVA